MNKQDITDAVVEAMTAHRSIDAETHQDHHAFISLMMEREARRADRRRKFELSFIGGLAIGAIGFLSWIGSLLVEGIKSHFHIGVQ